MVTMSAKEQIINEIIEVEGAYVIDPSDSGGETNFGVTEAVARGYGYTGAMRDMPREVAFDIYSAKYWDSVRADDMLSLSELVAHEVVDTGVNMGPAVAITFLQRVLNVLNDRGRLYSDLAIDGHIGPATLAALTACLATRDETVLCLALNCLQGAAYIELAERREKDERFLYGWLKNRVTL